MDKQNKKLSMKFYRFLCDIIGHKDVVYKRRHIMTVVDTQWSITNAFKLSSGSKAEGLDMNGSDYDLMLVANEIQVFERLEHVRHIGTNLPLIMDTKNIRPGFTKLLTDHSIRSTELSDCVDRRTGFSYLSSTLFRQSYFQLHAKNRPGIYIHGPCTTSGDGDNMFDYAYSLHCFDWISQALPWVERSKYSWASNEVIQDILSFGVLFVPIGYKSSPTSDLEWRISFSYAEKQLISCFNHVQLLCYALLKIMLNDIIKKAFDDLLCSYFMKTIMFWLCEETAVSCWRDDNILSCFMTCFRRLIYCVENQTCFHYFIPENNLFENRFERQHKKLLSTLRGLYDLGWTCLLETETLQSFKSYLEPSFISTVPLSTFFKHLGFLKLSALNNSECEYAKSIQKCLSQCIRSQKKERDIYIYFISSLFQFYAQQQCHEDLVKDNNKVLYTHLRRRLSYLLIGLNHDAVSGWLLLASFFFTNKQYNISKILIDYSLTKFTPERCELYGENKLWQLPRYFEVQNIIGIRCLKNYLISKVLILEKSFILAIIPETFHFAGSTTDGFMCFMPELYAHLLNFLLCFCVGDIRRIEESSRNFLIYLKTLKSR